MNRQIAKGADERFFDADTWPWSRRDPAMIRKCMKCRADFPSGGAGERICTRCKSSALWRTASAFAFRGDRPV